jgi:predicted DNA-binding transcriptional regulator AlpA
VNHEIPAILRYEDLRKLFIVSRSSLARWEAKSLFPSRVCIGENSIGWRRDQVQQWIKDRSNTNQEA